MGFTALCDAHAKYEIGLEAVSCRKQEQLQAYSLRLASQWNTRPRLWKREKAGMLSNGLNIADMFYTYTDLDHNAVLPNKWSLCH